MTRVVNWSMCVGWEMSENLGQVPITNCTHIEPCNEWRQWTLYSVCSYHALHSSCFNALAKFILEVKFQRKNCLLLIPLSTSLEDVLTDKSRGQVSNIHWRFGCFFLDRKMCSTCLHLIFKEEKLVRCWCNISKTSASVSSRVPNTEKQMTWWVLLLFQGVWNPWWNTKQEFLKWLLKRNNKKICSDTFLPLSSSNERTIIYTYAAMQFCHFP